MKRWLTAVMRNSFSFSCEQILKTGSNVKDMFDVNYTKIVVNQYYFGSGYTKDDHAFNELRLFGRGSK
jgi:hypothetical protein